MYQSPYLEIWNLTPGITAWTGAQTIFNIVGRLKAPQQIVDFAYRLNDGPSIPVFFNSTLDRLGRLHHPGDFNIDTISEDVLQPENRLTLYLQHKDKGELEETIQFHTTRSSTDEPRFHLDLTGVEQPEAVGQIVDGKWIVSRDESDEPCLEISRQDAGYDRIMIFGRQDWNAPYEITARLCPTVWLKPLHNVGLLYKWNPHKQGDGTHLPDEWNTALGYFYTNSRGLRIQYGVNVYLDEHKHEVGSVVLAEKPLSRWRYWAWRLKYDKNWPARYRRRKHIPLRHPFSQMIAGEQYRFRMHVHPERHALTVWRANKPEPAPQIVVERPNMPLVQGSVGILALYCAMRLYELDVTPLV